MTGVSVNHLATSIKAAFGYLENQQVDIPADVWQAAIKARIFAVKAEGDLPAISAAYSNVITVALTTYFEGGNVTTPRNQFKRSMIEAFGAVFDLGWVDGGQQMPPDPDALNWFNIRVDRELSYIESLFEQAKELRKENGVDFFSWVTDRAAAYARSLSGIYNAAQMFAKKNQMLTWRLGGTEKHCQTCAKLDGQSHRASWFVSRDYIPRKPGAAMLCGGYYCDCSLVDKQGNEVTV